MRMDLPVLTTLLVTLRLSGVAQGTPMEAFRGNIAAIHARDRAAYLSNYLHTPELARVGPDGLRLRSEEHTSELQARLHLVCRLLLEKKKKTSTSHESACAQ